MHPVCSLWLYVGFRQLRLVLLTALEFWSQHQWLSILHHHFPDWHASLEWQACRLWQSHRRYGRRYQDREHARHAIREQTVAGRDDLTVWGDVSMYGMSAFLIP